jgi:SAM-dependent methyltransferase
MGGVPDALSIQEAVRKKYAEVARSAAGRFKYPTGRAGLIFLGYDLSLIGDLPEEWLAPFCGVGNPFSLGPLGPGEAVLDVGCGAGIDLLFASRLVGETGQVCGIDLTPEMVARAQQTLTRAGVANAQVHLAGAEAIPYGDHTFEVVISNGVLNLSPLKDKSFSEMQRVLKSGGRLQFADIVLKDDLPAKVAASLQAWSE